MLQLGHHALSQHSTARLTLLPKAETKCEAENLLYSSRYCIVQSIDASSCNMHPSSAILAAQQDNLPCAQRNMPSCVNTDARHQRSTRRSTCTRRQSSQLTCSEEPMYLAALPGLAEPKSALPACWPGSFQMPPRTCRPTSLTLAQNSTCDHNIHPESEATLTVL